MTCVTLTWQGEKAKRRDPRRYRYSGTACPDFRKVRWRWEAEHALSGFVGLCKAFCRASNSGRLLE